MSAKADDLTGQRYGRLLVLRRHPENRNKRPVWVCLRDCGQEAAINAANLKTGNTTSCGCYRREFRGNNWRLPQGVAAKNAMAYQKQYRATRRGIPWTLSRTEAVALMSQPCFYCGCAPRHHWDRPDVNGGCYWNGIDRVDSKQGYTKENTVPCCGQCNKAKLDTPLDEFLAWVRRVYNHRAREGPELE